MSVTLKLAALLVFTTLIGGLAYTYSGYTSSSEGQRLLATTLDPTMVLTNPARTANVGTYCTVPRSQLVADSERTTNEQFNQFMKTRLPLVQSVMMFDMGAIMAVLPNLGIGLGITIAPFLIGLILSLTLWTCLLCCCVCPGGCPSKCCQHPEDQLYTKCQLIWPAIVLLVFMVIACAVSVPGLLQVGKTTDGIKSAECAISIMLDDVLNGNLTNDNASFFLGTVGLSQQLTALSTNLPVLAASAGASIAPILPTLLTATGTAKGALDLLPDGGTANTSFVLTYTDPTPRTPTGTTVTSSFGAALGTSAIAGSLCGNAYQSVNDLDASMTSLAGGLTTFAGAAPTMVTDIAGVIPDVDQVTTVVQGMDASSGLLYASVEGYLGYIKIGLTVFYSLVFALTGVTAVGGCFMVILNKEKFRYVMYGACGVMAIVAILGMLVSFVVSLVVPFLYLGCNALTSGLSTPSSFLCTSFSNLALTGILMLPPDISGSLSQCVPGGSGTVLSSYGAEGVSLAASVPNFFSLLAMMKTNANYDPTPISGSQGTISTVIGEYVSSARNDIIHDGPSLTWFQGLAAGTLPTACAADATFLLDSLVPSTAASSLANVPCASGKAVVTCADFATCAPGCIDLNSVMLSAGGSVATLQTKIATRYTAASAGCQTAIATDLSSYYGAWFGTMGSPATGIASVLARWTGGVSPQVTSVLSALSPVQTQLTAALTALEGSVTKITDPANGLQNGLNCVVLGEDLQRVRDTICVNIFDGLFTSLVTVGLSAFSLLLSMCCIVCTGVRYYKQNEMIKNKEEQQLKKSKPFGEREQTMISINEF